jgi:Helicase C-terminal domain
MATLPTVMLLWQVITRGSDQVAISSRFEVRNDPAVVRNFGSILVEYSKIVPDGIVAFFPSYLYMESIVAAWNDMVRLICLNLRSAFVFIDISLRQGILNEVWKRKLIFVETPDANETSIALENYRRVRSLQKREVCSAEMLTSQCRRATMVVGLCCCLSRVVRYLKASISTTITGAQSSCLGKPCPSF